MITRGVSDIRGIRNLNTTPGPVTETKGLLKLYQLAAEKDHLMKKLQWVRRQKDQTEKRLSEITHAIHATEHQAKRGSASHAHSELHETFIKY